MANSDASPQIQIVCVALLGLVILSKILNFAAKLGLALSITNAPKLKFVLCERACLITQYVVDCAKLLIECEVLHTCALQLVQVFRLVIVHHLHIVLHHA